MGDMDDALRINDDLAIPERELLMSAMRASGAGGQNVNKVATAIHLRFDIRNSSALPDAVRQRLLQLDDRRISAAGVLTIKSQEFRTQKRNREAALQRLRDLVLSVLEEDKPRVPTRPGRAAVRRRLSDKRRRGDVKHSRRTPDTDPH